MLRFWLLLLLCWAGLVHDAARASAVPLRKLCIESPLIVLATPVDPLVPTRFRIKRILRATAKAGPKVGDFIAPLGLTAQRVRTFDDADPETKVGKPRSIAQALLFLEPQADGKSWRLRPTGFRFCTADGRLLSPADEMHVPAVDSLRWVLIVRRVQEDVGTLAKLDALMHGPGRPARRVEALLDWIARHRGEFATVSPGTDEAPTGWDRLQLDLFDAIFALAAPEDAWRAVCLYAEYNGNEAPRLLAPTFTSPRGRAFLLRVASDPRQLAGDRIRAIHLLSERLTLWPNTDEHRQGGRVVTLKEQTTLLDSLSSLLPEKNEPLRVELARALRRISCPPGLADRRSTIALPALVKVYKEIQPGPARDELALTVCALAAPTQWKELTGNPAGVCAVLGDLQRRGSTLTFWVKLESAGGTVFETPTLIVERFGNFGFIAETKRLPLPVLNLDKGWAAGWNGVDTLASQVNLAGWLKPGNGYRVKVEGFVGKGKDRHKWLSEPRKFVVPAQRPGENVSGDQPDLAP